ncbi:histidine phosphatase family protein [Listeria cossartiae subsp. cayugensis]|uniref:histidine phosphatase family protein n=1 Tax=Listeria cossartiae TaxID=2838249 RepID=UPI00288067DF|nr:histidine phosphatase family protein [Listeria cossartiae]MDT0002221.1 histidine phosphatase family protein [Listeria cossartiae subsp. cayugensis]MDT0019411.1 histidine phosphatase family protein [Listeria cossartiae subsp. cayugensis]MDT0035016.1 histidine phosphatase family protein [Listeria cossartiae subsp. cayugensis]MDT0041161.1 histidine phosphatase family protein [Listeria cossartiae subsp. cayugensis]MDT0045718.1 histidine phosphatase family protein [Listeria cossartiae subsp. cay
MTAGKLNVYLVRHGKTMFNTSRRVQGWSDTPLTNEGIEVAEFLGRGLRGTPFDAVYTSDRGRTIETAGIVLHESKQAHLEINELRDFREFGFGKFEGEYEDIMFGQVMEYLGFKSVEEAFEKFGDDGYQIISETVEKIDETGMSESWDTMVGRLKNALETVSSENKSDNANVLVVSHGMAINTIISFFDKSLINPELANASVTRLGFENGKWTIEAVNDLSYIEAGKAVLV